MISTMERLYQRGVALFKECINKLNSMVENIKDVYMWVIVTGIYLISSILRSMPARNINLVTRYWDELIYFSYAKSFAENGTFQIRGDYAPFYKVLYSIAISPCIALFHNSAYQIPAICVWNAFLICSSVFPVYLLCKKMIRNRWIQLLVVGLTTSLPIMSISTNLLIESLYIPVSVWTAYFIYVYFDLENSCAKRRLLASLAVALFLSLSYFTKDIGLFMVGAFFLTAVYDILFEKKDARKSNVLFMALTLVVFGIFYYCGNLALSSLIRVENVAGSESVGLIASGFAHLRNITEWSYFIYVNVISLLMVIMGMGTFPVIFSGLSYAEISHSKKMFWVFSYVVLIVTVLGVSFTITIRETPLASYFYHNYRYSEHLAMFFYILFFSCVESVYQCVFREKMIHNYILCGTVWGLIFFFVFRFLPNGILLSRYHMGFLTRFDDGITGDAGLYMVTPSLLLFKLLFLAFCLIVGVLFCTKKFRAFSVLIIVLSIIFFNYNTNMDYYNTYYAIVNSERASGLIPQAIILNEYCETKIDGTILKVIKSDFGQSASIADSYIQVSENLTTVDYLKAISEEDGTIDLFSKRILGNSYDGVYNYDDLLSVDYIICDDGITFSEDQATEIHIEGVKDLHLFKLCNSNHFKPIYNSVTFFPQVVGENQYETFDEGNLYTTGVVCDEGVVSNAENEVIIYGPYCPITEGKYQIVFFYTYGGSKSDEVIGNVDLVAGQGGSNFGVAEFSANDNMVVLDNVYVDGSYEDAEVRMTAYQSGVSFQKMVISKIE